MPRFDDVSVTGTVNLSGSIDQVTSLAAVTADPPSGFKYFGNSLRRYYRVHASECYSAFSGSGNTSEHPRSG